MSGLVFRNVGSLAQSLSSSFPVKDLEAGTPAAPQLLGGSNFKGLLGGGGGGGEKTAPAPPITEWERKKIAKLLDSKVPYDNKPARDILLSVAAKTGLPPEFIAASSLQEGMNMSIDNPNDASEAYSNAKVDSKLYPVDGFYNYGLDTFADAYPRLVKKGYLPGDFKYFPYKAQNEQKMFVNTAAFSRNEDAVLAKAAYMKDFMDTVKDEAKKRGLELDDRATRFFTMAGYNGGPGGLKAMLDEMKELKLSSDDYIKQGSKKKAQVYKNIMPRMAKMDYLAELFSTKNSK